jgi:hypothetical protein
MNNFACILIFVVFQKECGKWEAHVVRLETQEENSFLKSLMANYFKGEIKTFSSYGENNFKKWKN